MKKIICICLTVLTVFLLVGMFSSCSFKCNCKHQVNFLPEREVNKWLSENDVEIVDIEYERSSSNYNYVMVEYIDHSCGK